LSSPRTAPVTNTRFFQPTCCWKYTPTVAFSTNVSPPSRIEPPETVEIGGAAKF
jgi:hypothetical protein